MKQTTLSHVENVENPCSGIKTFLVQTGFDSFLPLFTLRP